MYEEQSFGESYQDRYDDWKEADDRQYDESEVIEMIRLIEKYQKFGMTSIEIILDHKNDVSYKEAI